MSNIGNEVADKVQRAITLIKSGDKQGGQRLLAEVLAADPRNEQAWLWMSTVVDADKRRFCLQKALSINPDNAQARLALERLSQQSPPSSLSPAVPEVQSPAGFGTQEITINAKSSAGPAKPEIVSTEVWIKRRKYYFDVSILTGDELVVGRAYSWSNRKQEIQDRVEQGLPLVDLLYTHQTVSLRTISKVVLSLGTVNVYYDKADGGAGWVYVPCPDAETAKAALDALHQRLGPEFERTEAPVRTCMALGIPTVVMVIVMAVTGFLYWGAQEAAKVDHITGSARTRGMTMLLQLIGPNGVLCIGGVFLLLSIVLLVRWGLNPPLETTIAPQSKDAVV